MPGNVYSLRYESEASQFLAESAKIEASLRAIDALADQVKPKIRSLTSGAIAGLSQYVGKLDQLLAALTKLNPALIQTATQVAQVSANSAAAAGNVQTLHLHSNQTTKSIQNLTISTKEAAMGLGSMYVARLALHEVVDVIDAIGDALQKSRDFARETAEENLKLYNSLREFKNLKGGTTEEAAAEIVGMRMRTGLTAQEAEQFQSQYLGAVDAARVAYKTTGGEKGIAEKDIPAMGEHAAVLAKRTGMDMETAGKLAGLIGQYEKVGSAEEGAQSLAEISHHLNVEGVGKVHQLAKPFVGLLSDFVSTGRVGNAAETASIFSVGTRAYRSGPTAATGMRQADRLLRKMATSDNPEIQKLGIGLDDDFLTALKKARPMLSEGAKSKAMLKDFGVGGNITEVDSAMKYASLIEQIDEAIGSKEAKTTRAGVLAKNQEFLTTDKGALGNIGQANLEAGRFVAGKKFENLTIARRTAEGQMTASGQIGSPGTALGEQAFDAVTHSLFGTARERRTDAEIRKKLLEVDPSLAKRYPDLLPNTMVDSGLGSIPFVGPLYDMASQQGMGTGASGHRLAQILNELEPEFKAKGINLAAPSKGLSESVEATRVPASPPGPDGMPAPPAKGGGFGGLIRSFMGGLLPGTVGVQAGADANSHASNEVLGPKLDKMIEIQEEQLRRTASAGVVSRARGGGDLPDFTANYSPYREGSI